ncbi:unnamed protein product, partial [Staurois parvus]
MMGHYSCHWILMMGCYFLPLTPMMGHYSSHLDTQNGARLIPLTPKWDTIPPTDTNDGT